MHGRRSPAAAALCNPNHQGWPPSHPCPSRLPARPAPLQISRACYNAFRAHLTSKRTFAAEAKEFFAECDAVVPKLEFEEEKPKVARGVNFASAKGQQVNAASLAPQGRVNAKQVEEPVPIAETAEEMPVVDEVAEDVGFVADELPADLTEEIPLVDAFGTEFVVPKTALDAINQTSPMLLELIQVRL